jgi:hypothetical protein
MCLDLNSVSAKQHDRFHLKSAYISKSGIMCATEIILRSMRTSNDVMKTLLLSQCNSTDSDGNRTLLPKCSGRNKLR